MAYKTANPATGITSALDYSPPSIPLGYSSVVLTASVPWIVGSAAGGNLYWDGEIDFEGETYYPVINSAGVIDWGEAPFGISTTVYYDDGSTVYGPQVIPASDPEQDDEAPTVVLSAPGSTQSGTFLVTATFDEVVSAPEAAGFTVVGGTKGSVSGAGSVYSIPITPPADSSGKITVQLAAGASQDLAGNDSVASGQIEINYNTLVPAPPNSDGPGGLIVEVTTSITVGVSESPFN